MALTITEPLNNYLSPRVPGADRRLYVKIQLDSSYPNTGTFSTSGYSLTPDLFGLSEIFWINTGDCMGNSNGNVNTSAAFDPVNLRLHLYDSSDGSEWENGTSFTTKGPAGGADFLYAEVIGH